LDLNIGYYHIELSAQTKKLCTTVLPWGKYEYQQSPMGLCNSLDIFQEKISILMADLEYVRAYIDDSLILTRGSRSFSKTTHCSILLGTSRYENQWKKLIFAQD
jgi:hypothetical protein